MQTELTGAHQASDPAAIPQDTFIEQVAALLENNNDIEEVLVERVKFLALAQSSGE